VRAGLGALALEPPDLVLIHDAARPFVSAELIDRVLDGLGRADGALPALLVADTLKRSDGDLCVADTVPRANLWRAQTPQGFRYSAITEARRRAGIYR
jgi:2-C-methyl-D-erythritol 4-phosphate cytidylyltransferase/2-C-methyl-D-erythritol 2,4-cyclodiphosphate synthase